MRTDVGSKKPVWITVGAVLLFHILLLSVQTNKRFNTGFMRVWMLDSMAPFEKVVDVGVKGVSGVWNGYFDLVGVHRDNERLRAENNALRMQVARQNEQVLEADRLRKLLDLQTEGLGKTVVAQVIGHDADPSQLHQTVTIDKGQVHGIQQDASVITPDGVVGRVIVAGNFSSIVQLITDSQSHIGALVGTARRQAIVKGTGGREVEIDYIEDDNGIKPGDRLVTSGMDRVHSKGLPLGFVTSVAPGNNLFKIVKIRPAADLSRLEEVVCIMEHPPEVAEPDLEPAAANTN
jgi:rod shape-determining protein MreC